MNNDSGQSVSFWMASGEVPARQPLAEDAEADVCIVGAGIAGLSVAYLLAKEGRPVIVLDDGPVGGGETGRTTAHLSNALDDRYQELERLFGGQGARLAAQSHTEAIDRIERIVAEEGIDCDFERLDGYLFAPPGESTEVLDKELAAAHRAGLTDVTRVERAPIPDFDTGPSLKFPRQGQFHVLKYLAGLAAAIERAGGRICTGSHVTAVFGGQHARVKTRGGPTVRASQAVVVATNSPINDRLAMHTKQAAYRSYVLGLRIPTGSVPHALFWDTPDPYHYVRVQPASGYDLLIVGGEDHKTGHGHPPEDRYERLERWTRERFPMAGEVEFRWSGQVLEPVDALAFTGHNPLDDPNVYIHTGDSGHGMTHGTIAGILLTDLIQGRQNPWADLYDPGRITLGAAADFAKENVDVFVRFGDWLTPGDVDQVKKIAPGSGGVIRRGLHKVAVYRDEQGELHGCSAVCPHLGCIVDWNGAEATWDCPCHGSRFDRYGKVINGPANSDLKVLDKQRLAK